MDTENRNGVIGDQGITETEKGTGKGTGTGTGSRTGTRNTSTGAGSPGTGTGTGAGTGAAEKNAPAENIGLPINIPVPIPDLPGSKKGKGSSGGSKSDKGLDKTLESNVRLLISAGFTLAGKALKTPIWELSDEEAATISTPLTKILQRLGLNDSMSKYADYIALGTAVTVVTVPRIMLQREIMLQQKQLAEGGQPINGGKKKTGKAGTPKATGSDPSVDSVVPGAGIKAVLDANTTGT